MPVPFFIESKGVRQLAWNEAEVFKLKELYQSGLSYRKIAERLGRNVKSIDNKIQRLGLARGVNQDTDIISYLIRLPRVREVEGDFVISSDFHIPCHDEKLVAELINTAKEFDVDQLIVAGDFLNFDSMSTFISRTIDPNDELQMAGSVVEYLLRYFKKIYLVPGNHEFRFNRKLGKIIDFERLVKMFTESDKVYASEHDHLILGSGGNDFRVCHPKNYSVVKGRVSIRLAGKYGMNIIAGHSHYCGINISDNGRHLAVDTGGLFDKKKIEHSQQTTLNPEWNQGFCVVFDGRCELFSPVMGNC